MTATDSYLLLRAFCDELARCGLRHACTSPGSRSTPIVLTLARNPRIAAWSHIDERCAGFFALGAAKASGRPTAITCTSGTAAANFAPAVIEAFHARVPLLILTADRPPELREVGAGQAIDQIKLFGDAVKWFFEVGTFSAGVAQLRWIRELACRAYFTAAEGRPGPVHLNFPLHEPLVLDAPLPPDPVSGRPHGRPWVSKELTASIRVMAPRTLPPRGVIIAGRDERGDGTRSKVVRLAERAGFPVLADPLSGARHCRVAIARYDLLLRSQVFTGRMRPDMIIRVGDLPTSKALRSWLASLTDIEQLLLDPEALWQDPDAAVSRIDFGPPGPLLDAFLEAPEPDLEWLESWLAADDAATMTIEKALGRELSEPRVAALIGESLDQETILVVASSMPIRDVELYFPARRPLPRTLSNRGANGIDGTVSTAFGVAAASGNSVVLLIGDVALLHDLGGLLASRRLGLKLTIVVINNDGGGIFHFLAVRGERDAFEEHVATPHGVSMEQVARLFGLRFERVASAEELRGALADLTSPEIGRLIEVRTDRERNLALHRRIERSVLEEVSRRAPEA